MGGNESMMEERDRESVDTFSKHLCLKDLEPFGIGLGCGIAQGTGCVTAPYGITSTFESVPSLAVASSSAD
jgi:hypothetical protein